MKTPKTLKRTNAALWWGIEAIVLLLSGLALWQASLTYEGYVEGMFPWQIGKLRGLLITGGAWLAFVGVAVPVIYLFHNRAGGSGVADVPGQSRFRLPVLVLSLCVGGSILAYGWLACERHRRFNSTGYDLAIQEQVLWNTVHGRLFASSVEVENMFADHFQPSILALVPLYALIPASQLLLGVQAVGLGIGALPVYRLARRRLDSPGLALAVAAAYLLCPSIGFVQRFDFHPEALAVSAFLFAFDALDRDAPRAASLWLLVPLLSKENLGFSVAAFGLYAATFGRRVRFGLAWAGVGLAVSSATMFWLIPAVRHGPSDTLSRYEWLGETPIQMVWVLISRPGYVWQTVANPNRALYLLQLLVPTGFLALLGLPELLMAVPGLVINLLAAHHCQARIYCQYTVPIVPFVFVAAVTGLERLERFLRCRRAWTIIGLAVVPLSILALRIDNPFTEAQDVPAPLAQLPNAEAVYRALATVPPGLSVVTTNAYAPHLAQREELYIIGIPAQRDAPTDPDVVFVNLYDQRFMVCDQYRGYFSQLDVDRYGVIFRDSGMIVVLRDGGSNEGFRDFVLDWTDCAG